MTSKISKKNSYDGNPTFIIGYFSLLVLFPKDLGDKEVENNQNASLQNTPLWRENYFQLSAIKQKQTHKQQKALFLLKGRIHLLLLETNSYQVQKGHQRNLHIFTFLQFGALGNLNLSPKPVLTFLYKCTTLCWKFSLSRSSKQLLWVTLPLLVSHVVCAIPINKLHFSWFSLVAQTVKCLSTMQETQVQSLGWKDPLEKEMATHSSSHAWKIP